MLSNLHADGWKEAWSNCLPAELSELFYEKTNHGFHRVNGFQLIMDEKSYDYFEGLDLEKVKGIRVYMGCDQKAFKPMLSVIRKGNSIREQYFSLEQVDWYTHKDNFPSITKSDGPQLTEVTKEIAKLFVQKWEELSDQELKDSFSGLTKPQLKTGVNASDRVQTLRVKSYLFSKEDAKLLIQQALKSKNNIWLLLGAGLTVHLTHPFNFRPILYIAGSGNAQGGSDGGTYFERSGPCPPYCS